MGVALCLHGVGRCDLIGGALTADKIVTLAAFQIRARFCWRAGSRACVCEFRPNTRPLAAHLPRPNTGPSLNILIKLMAVESLVFAPFFANIAGGEGLIFQFFSGN